MPAAADSRRQRNFPRSLTGLAKTRRSPHKDPRMDTYLNLDCERAVTSWGRAEKFIDGEDPLPLTKDVVTREAGGSPQASSSTIQSQGRNRTLTLGELPDDANVSQDALRYCPQELEKSTGVQARACTTSSEPSLKSDCPQKIENMLKYYKDREGS